MDNSSVIATWLVLDNESEASDFPQAGVNSADVLVQNIYWRCVVVFFATSRAVGNCCRHVFYSNSTSLPTVDGCSVAQLLSKYGVEVRVVPITHRLGRERVLRWNNQFYIMDILRDIHSIDVARAVVLDADCVWVKSANDMLADIDRREILTLCIPYPSDQQVNGASRRELRRAVESLSGRKIDYDPHYAGGEFFGASRIGIQRVYNLAVPMWRTLCDPSSNAVPIYEEGHFLSVIYDLLDIPFGTADAHVRRMLTALTFSNVSWEDVYSSRCVWHLPEEKNVGFNSLFRAAIDEKSWLWSSSPDDLPVQMAKAFGLPRRSFRQLLLKLAQRSKYKIQRRFSSA